MAVPWGIWSTEMQYADGTKDQVLAHCRRLFDPIPGCVPPLAHVHRLRFAIDDELFLFEKNDAGDISVRSQYDPAFAAQVRAIGGDATYGAWGRVLDGVQVVIPEAVVPDRLFLPGHPFDGRTAQSTESVIAQIRTNLEDGAYIADEHAHDFAERMFKAARFALTHAMIIGFGA